MNAEKVSLVIKEIAEKSGKKGLYWSIKDEKGLVYNASKEIFPMLHAGDKLETSFNTVEYDNNGKTVKSRWLLSLAHQNLPEEQKAVSINKPIPAQKLEIFLKAITGTAGKVSVDEMEILWNKIQASKLGE